MLAHPSDSDSDSDLVLSLMLAHPSAPAGRHHEAVPGAAVAAGVVLHAQVVADLVRHHVHRGKPGAGVRLP